MNEFTVLATRLVECGYATTMKEKPYGLTKLKTYEVFVEGEGWQDVNPFGTKPYSKPQFHALNDFKAMQEALKTDD